MSRDLAVLVASTAAVVVAAFLVTTPPPPARPRRREEPGGILRVAIAAVASAVVFAASGWVLPALVVGGATWFVVRRVQRSADRVDDVARTEALASWIENLRDVLLAGDQPIGAIAATVPTCPPTIRPAVRRLSTALGHQPPDVAFRRFADEIDDPLGDLVAAGLLVAVQRGARTVGVLSALAAQARTHADRRRLVGAERAPITREVTVLTVVMGGLVVGLLVFARADYLAPYDTARGQLVVTVVLVVYGLLLVRVQRLARFPRPRRFLGTVGAEGAA